MYLFDVKHTRERDYVRVENYIFKSFPLLGGSVGVDKCILWLSFAQQKCITYTDMCTYIHVGTTCHTRESLVQFAVA
jgi:hypothetical protein